MPAILPQHLRSHSRPLAKSSASAACCFALLGILLAAHAGFAQQRTAPRRGTLVIGGASDLQSMNALINNDSWTGEFITNVMFLPLVRLKADLSYIPALAESWRFSGDTAVTFQLRRDVRWHDGPRTTAYDVAFTFDRIKDPATAFPNRYFDRWQNAQVVDSFTIRFRLRPHVDPLLGWTLTPVMPKHLLDSIPAARMRQAAFNKQPVGNGPFRFVSEQPNDRWVFEANPEYPRSLGGRPFLDRVVWRVIPDNNAQATALGTGEIDVAVGVRAEQLKQLTARSNLRVVMRPSNQYAAVMWNTKRPPLNDVRVRRALTMALNRQQIIDVVRSGYAQIAASPVPPWHWAYDRKVSPLPYDPDGARRLLAATGYSRRNASGVLEDSAGKTLQLELKVPAVAVGRDVGEMVRAGLGEIGVKVLVRPTDFGALIQDVNGPRDFDGVFLAASADFRLDFTDLFHSKSSTAWYHDPRLDTMLERALVVTDRAEAARNWQQVQKVLRDDQPWTFVWWAPQIIVMRKGVRGADMDIRGALRSLPSWRVNAE